MRTILVGTVLASIAMMGCSGGSGGHGGGESTGVVGQGPGLETGALVCVSLM